MVIDGESFLILSSVGGGGGLPCRSFSFPVYVPDSKMPKHFRWPSPGQHRFPLNSGRFGQEGKRGQAKRSDQGSNEGVRKRGAVNWRNISPQKPQAFTGASVFPGGHSRLFKNGFLFRS